MLWQKSKDEGKKNNKAKDKFAAGYRVFRNGYQIADVTATSYTDIGLFPGAVYSYTVAAYDVSGNVSAQSPPISATTFVEPPRRP